MALEDALETPALMVNWENAEKLVLTELKEIADQTEFLEKTASLDQGDLQDQPAMLVETVKTERREKLERMERMVCKDQRDHLVLPDKWELAVRRVNREPLVKQAALDHKDHVVPPELVETMDLVVTQEHLDEMAALDNVENQGQLVLPV